MAKLGATAASVCLAQASSVNHNSSTQLELSPNICSIASGKGSNGTLKAVNAGAGSCAEIAAHSAFGRFYERTAIASAKPASSLQSVPPERGGALDGPA